MTAVVGRPERSTSWLPVSLALAKRSLVATWRVPASFLPLAVMPLFLVVTFSGAFEGLTELPTFPTDKAVNWVLPFGIIMGSGFAGMAAGFGAVRDMQSGFFDRLLLMPGSRAGLLMGPVWASAVRGGLTSAVVLLFGFALGAELPGGILGLLVMAVASFGVGGMALAWTLGLVYRMPSMRAAPLVQVGIFFPAFLSTGQVPLSEQTGWAHAVARCNPITNILELARQGLLGHVTWASTWPGLVAIAASLVVLWTFTARGVWRLIP